MPAKTFSEIMKFNPFHDARGRFASESAATSFTYAPGKSKAHDLAIQRQKERQAARMPSEAQAKTLKGIETRTRNLKKEQYRVVDREGNVILQKQGDSGSVTYTMGEARDNIPGNITIHNHPAGGTFSPPDLSDIGHGATEIRAASPEGTYILRNTRYGTRYDPAKEKTWYDMREDIETASESFKTHRQVKSEVRKPFDEQLRPMVDKWERRRNEGASQEELVSLANEYTKACDALKPQIEAAARKAYVDQYHQWYKSNAANYGLEYEFIPVETRARKSIMMKDYHETIEKGDGDIVLDRQMNQDVVDITNSILEEMKAALPVQKSAEIPENEVSILKTDDDKRLVFGWASISITVDGVQLEDRQQDMIDPEDLEEAAYEYVLKFRDTGEEHIPTMRKKGKLVESCVFTAEKQQAMGIPAGTLPIGWWVGFKIEDEDAWARVKNGTYKMFSIEGRASREPVEKSVEKVEKNMPQRTIKKSDPNRFDYIEEVRVAKSFSEIIEIEKFNPYHDARGRFASANGGTFFATPGKSKAHDLAISREQERQAGAVAKSLVASAKEKEPAMTQTLQSCAGAVGGKMVGLEYAVKSEGSLARKIKTEMRETGKSAEEAAANMKDVNRYTMQLGENNFADGYNRTMETLQSQGYEVVRVKNTLSNPDAEYRGINANIRNSDGSIWELQFHTEKSLEVKEINHKLYEEQRLDDTTPERKAALGAEMASNAASIPMPSGVEGIKSFSNL